MWSRAIKTTVGSRSAYPIPKKLIDFHGKCYASSVPKNKSRFAYPEGMVAYEEDYSEKPEYPEINPEIHTWTEEKRIRRRQKTLDWHTKIREQPSPEAKILEMNMPRKYGWITTVLREDSFDYDSQDFYKFFTRTHLDSDNQLPDFYNSPEITEKAKHFAEKVKEPLLEALRFEIDGQSHSYQNDLGLNLSTIDFKKSQSLITQVNRVILSVLGNEVDHLQKCQVDYTPKVEAFWFIGGQQPSGRERAARKGAMDRENEHYKARIKENDPVERNIQYIGSPLLQVRCENPIRNIVNENSDLCKRSIEEFPDQFPYDINHYSIHKEFRWANLTPGTWAGDSHKCSQLAFHPRHHLLTDFRRDNKYWNKDNENAIASQAMLASFGRLLSQALYHGFDQFTDLNYPFSTQTIVTDGINFSFFAYQLNTIQLAKFHMQKNNKQNICWGTKTQSIFDEKNPGTLNSDVVETLLKFYINPSIPIPVENPLPYLKSSLTDWDEEIQREIVFYNYRDMASRRYYLDDNLRRWQFPETYEWEKIYKIRHPQRHMDARRRHFELPMGFPGSKPYDEPYFLRDPRKIKKRLKVLQEEVAARKEKESIEAAKKAEMAKYGVYDEE